MEVLSIKLKPLSKYSVILEICYIIKTNIKNMLICRLPNFIILDKQLKTADSLQRPSLYLLDSLLQENGLTTTVNQTQQEKQPTFDRVLVIEPGQCSVW